MNEYKELEVKILNIDVDKIKNILNQIGAKYKNKVLQHIITYDCYDAIDMYNMALNDYKKTKSLYSLKKIKNIYNYVEPIINKDEKEMINNIYNMPFTKYLDGNVDYKMLNNPTLKKIIRKCQKRFYKWIRLRINGDKIELTIKYIYSTLKEYDIDSVREVEITVNDFNAANILLEELGYIPKKEQEKIRTTYEYNNLDITIDEWPLIEPYLEIEGKNVEDIYRLVEKLGYKKEDAKVMNTDDVYSASNIILDDYSKMTFEEQIKS